MGWHNMKRLLICFVILLAAVWAGLKIAANPGYLLIAYQKNTIQMPLWFAALSLIFIFVALYFSLRFLSNVFSLGAKLRSWSRTRKVKRAWIRTHRGLISLAAGHYAKAQRDLLRAAPYTEAPLINYLAAARAAQLQHHLAERDDYLSRIKTPTEMTELAVGLTQVELYLAEKQFERALVVLQRLQHLAPKHVPVLYLLAKTYRRLNDWGQLEILLPELKKRHVLIENDWEQLRSEIYVGLLKTALKQPGDAANIVWERIPKELRATSEFLILYLPMLDQKTKESYLEKNERKLKEQGEEATLLFLLGQLCVGLQLWGKARSYFASSLRIKPTASTYAAIAQLEEKLGDNAQALEYYRKGLELKS